MFAQKTKMGSIIGHRIDYNRGRDSESPCTQVTPPGVQGQPARKAGLKKSDDKAQDTSEEILDDEAQDETDEAFESDLV